MPEQISLENSVNEEYAGSRLDQAAAELFRDYSRARLQQWIKQGDLTVNGARAKPSMRLMGGEMLRIEAQLIAEGEVEPQDIPLEVLFEDKHLIVVNKPTGLVVHPAAGNWDGTLQNALLNFDKELDTLPRSGIVHRLDKDTSGIMVVARSLKAHASLVNQFNGRPYPTDVIDPSRWWQPRKPKCHHPINTVDPVLLGSRISDQTEGIGDIT